MLTLQEAAQKAGVSEKTLRRAISSGRLTAHQRETGGTHNNQPFMIDEQDLETWIASRQPQASTVDHPGLAETIQRMQEQAEIDHKLQSSRIDTLEKRIASLETALQDTQDLLIQLRNQPQETSVPTHEQDKAEVPTPEANPVPTRESTPESKKDKTSYKLADFTKSLQREYRSDATRKDVWSVMILRPDQTPGAEAQGHYCIWLLDYGKVNPRGNIGKDQKWRGEQLERDLKERVLAELAKAGWEVVTEGVYVKQDARV